MKIIKGDNVIVISGKDKGRKGRVIASYPKDRSIIVEGINLKKKHQKPKSAGKKGEKIEVPRPVSVSSVMLICKNCNNPTRVGYKVLDVSPLGEASKKVRICKKCGQAV